MGGSFGVEAFDALMHAWGQMASLPQVILD